MLGEKYMNQIFLLYSVSESTEVSPSLRFKLCELSVKMTPAEDFFKLNPHSWICRVFDPPLHFLQECPKSHHRGEGRRGGVFQKAKIALTQATWAISAFWNTLYSLMQITSNFNSYL